MDTPTPTRPTLKLTGTSGNAFAVMGAAKRAATLAGWDTGRINLLLADMTSGDYDHLLATAMTHFDVT